jgi:hypothetical protein
LSLGYATITHQPQGAIFATILPAVMLGSLTAIIFSGALNYVGKRYPHLTGEGRLQPAELGDALAGAEIAEEERPTNHPITAGTVAAAGLTAITLYLVGMIMQDLTGFAAPVLMLFVAVVLKLARAQKAGRSSKAARTAATVRNASLRRRGRSALVRRPAVAGHTSTRGYMDARFRDHGGSRSGGTCGQGEIEPDSLLPCGLLDR